MKQELTLKGRFELEPSEITEAGMKFEKDPLPEAITKWLALKYNYTPKRQNITFEHGKIIAEIDAEIREGALINLISNSAQNRRLRGRRHVKPNKGIFSFIKYILEDAREKGHKSISFDKIFAKIEKEQPGRFPTMSKKYLNIYLQDDYFSDFTYDTVRKQVNL